MSRCLPSIPEPRFMNYYLKLNIKQVKIDMFFGNFKLLQHEGDDEHVDIDEADEETVEVDII